MEKIRLSPSVLSWAANEAGLSLDLVAEKLSRRSADKILNGELTEPQAERFATITGVPLGYLFLKHPPPPRKSPIADFRTVQQAEPLSPNFFACFDEIQFKQEWYREYLDRIGAEPLDFVGKYAGSKNAVMEIAQDIRRRLQLTNLDRKQLRSPDDLYSFLVERCENVGILVFKSGIVGNNTHRPLSVREFRGFAISDRLAPAVFINGTDAPAAWCFTLAHELAHIWLGESGISDTNPQTKIKEEARCNAIAAETLAPKGEFQKFWSQKVEAQRMEPLRAIAEGRLLFRISEVAVARRALDLGLITFELYQEVHAQSLKGRRKDSPGGDYYRTLSVRNSKKFTQRVASMAMSGSLSFREAGKLLGVAPNRIENVYKKSRAIPA